MNAAYLTPAITLFHEDGSLDFESQEHLFNNLIENGVDGILVEGSDRLTMSGYNMQTGIRTAFEAEVHEEGRIVLNARLFGEIIRKLPDDLVVFAADEKYMVRLTCGDASFEIMGLSAEDYPELPEVDDEYSVAIQQGTLKAMINQTSFAVSTSCFAVPRFSLIQIPMIFPISFVSSSFRTAVISSADTGHQVMLCHILRPLKAVFHRLF